MTPTPQNIKMQAIQGMEYFKLACWVEVPLSEFCVYAEPRWVEEKEVLSFQVRFPMKGQGCNLVVSFTLSELNSERIVREAVASQVQELRELLKRNGQ